MVMSLRPTLGLENMVVVDGCRPKVWLDVSLMRPKRIVRTWLRLKVINSRCLRFSVSVYTLRSCMRQMKAKAKRIELSDESG